MKTCFYNGTIYQGNKEFVEAMVIEDDTIIYCGNSAEAFSKYKEAKQIDLKNKIVIPGFNDSHMHLISLARTYAQASISSCSSIDNLITSIKNFKDNNPSLCNNGIYTRGFKDDLFIEKRLPNAFDLDRVSTTIPVVVSRVCGHISVLNHKALDMLDKKYGLDRLPKEEIYRDEKGNPTGVVTEMTVFKAEELIPKITYEELKKLIIKALKYCASVGLTSIQSNDINDFNNEDYIFNMIDEIYEDNLDLIRYTHQCCFKDYDDFKDTLINNRYHLKKQIDKVKLGPLKLYKDGSLGGRTAELYDSYKDDPGNRGIGVNSGDDIYKYVSLANKYNIQVITHSIGDKAIDEVANAYIKANAGKENPNRHAIVHAQITSEEILKKIGENNLSLFYQPIFLEYDIHIVNKRVGEKLASTSYAFKTAKQYGAQVSFGSDCPIEDCNAFYNLHCAINRTDLSDEKQIPYNKEECMNIYDAIDSFTYQSAKAEFMEDKLGLLKEGYLADFIIVNEDVFHNTNNIKNIKPLETYVGGKIAYKR